MTQRSSGHQTRMMMMTTTTTTTTMTSSNCRRSSSSSRCCFPKLNSVISVLCVLIGVAVLLVNAEDYSIPHTPHGDDDAGSTRATNSEREAHRHRQHHGHEPRSRPRRVGRETDAPLVQNYQSYLSEGRVTEPYAPYNYRSGPDEPLPRSTSDHQNLHKPEFTNCIGANPSVPESEPVNTTVFTVQATDQDPPESGGTITYTIVSGNENNEKFVIDPRTGVIRTNKVFDRDEPEREKEEYVTIRATDNGRPQLDSVCTIKIVITDINDGVPLFERFEYKESVPQDLGVDQVVMRVSATDIDDGDNGAVTYKLDSHPDKPGDLDYFKILPKTGEVQLKKPIDSGIQTFLLRAIATDKGVPPKSAATNLTITVIEPRTRPPIFEHHPDTIDLQERGVDKTRPIVTLTARSNSAGSSQEDLVFFELVNGQTEPTNKGAMFTLEKGNGNTALLKLDKDLDYETVSKYTLTIRASNTANLASETTITIHVKDDNDEKPDFTEVTSGKVLENEPRGTSVMRVRAIDRDGTSPNNEVTYTLKEEDKENFQIDPTTGEITTMKEFDRELKDVYQVTVIARDGNVSALRTDGQPNERPVTLKIEIADKNDNEPSFLKTEYEAEISEDANVNNRVIEVKAEDKDTESEIVYSIQGGNFGDVFEIRSSKSGGVIHVKNPLDYENRTQYTLTVVASDSIHQTHATVRIRVLNINDERPVFKPMNSNTSIGEEKEIANCIFNLEAYDPDIGDRTAPQNIAYFIYKGQEHFDVDSEGCVKVIKRLDRDPPNGSPFVQVIVGAYDEGGNTSTKLASYQVLQVNLEDINDNAPFYNGPNPVVWYENQPKGPITKLVADDYDTEKNGAPFNFQIDRNAPQKIKNYFKIEGNMLYAEKDNFDREQQKEYIIPVLISDSGQPAQSGVSMVTVVIGDINDNPMYPGSSKIFVYKYKEEAPFAIGRVYVEDADDWDLPDKKFDWFNNGHPHPSFTLDHENGFINMKPALTSEGTYQLTFKVTDNKRNEAAVANVTVTVKEITDEAVDNSGSIRFMGITKENFIKPDKEGKSKKDILQAELATRFGVPLSNVDVFTVLNPLQSPDPNKVDVRYSVHNSPYWKAERLDGTLSNSKDALEKALQLNILMIRIDECISERLHCEASCTNHLNKSKIAYKIYTNTSSFVGVDAYVTPECTCSSAIQQSACLPNPCLYDGICKSGGDRDGFECECKDGYAGPRCEITSISFPGKSYAWYEPLSVCNDSTLEVDFVTRNPTGLILYNGPIFPSPMNVTDFISLELRNGKPILLMDYGSGVARVDLPDSADLADSKSHTISIKWTPKSIEMQVDDCARREQRKCYSGIVRPVKSNTQLNVNGPLQLGGISVDVQALQPFMSWSSIPTTQSFVGCIANLTFNRMYYNLGAPSHVKNMNISDCNNPFPLGVATGSLGVDWNFIIVILVSLLVLILLIIAFLFYRKRRNYIEVGKGEFNDDVRDNILHYSDEGGGEGDQTGYDLSVLMKASSGPPYINPHMDKIAMDDLNRQGRAPDNGDGPDIQSFLSGNKNKVDNDPDGLPYDDVRNYAYEGDGNSMGSLSSLASGTDDEDLNFDFLPAFGPRFKKLADMYGGQSSDDESYTPPPEAWC